MHTAHRVWSGRSATTAQQQEQQQLTVRHRRAVPGRSAAPTRHHRPRSAADPAALLNFSPSASSVAALPAALDATLALKYYKANKKSTRVTLAVALPTFADTLSP